MCVLDIFMTAICAVLSYLLQFVTVVAVRLICSLGNPTKRRSLNYGAFNHVYETEKRIMEPSLSMTLWLNWFVHRAKRSKLSVQFCGKKKTVENRTKETKERKPSNRSKESQGGAQVVRTHYRNNKSLRAYCDKMLLLPWRPKCQQPAEKKSQTRHVFSPRQQWLCRSAPISKDMFQTRTTDLVKSCLNGKQNRKMV